MKKLKIKTDYPNIPSYRKVKKKIKTPYNPKIMRVNK